MIETEIGATVTPDHCEGGDAGLFWHCSAERTGHLKAKRGFVVEIPN